jgi:hypothetical protein
MTKEKCEKDAICDTCNQSSSCNQQEKEAHAQEKLKSTFSHIKYEILVMIGKGGVGKTQSQPRVPYDQKHMEVKA